MCAAAVIVALLSFTHKFYVGIYQIDFVPQKKMVQITTRIFIDDMAAALAKNSKQAILLGEPNETPYDEMLLKQYLNDNLSIKINNKKVSMEFMSKELEGDVLICYLRCTNVSKISKFEMTNTILFDYVTEQQNIIQTNINGQKKSLLLTFSKDSGQLAY